MRKIKGKEEKKGNEEGAKQTNRKRQEGETKERRKTGIRTRVNEEKNTSKRSKGGKERK